MDRCTLDKCTAARDNFGLLDHRVRSPELIIKADVHFIKKWKKSLPIAALVKGLAIMK